MTVPGLFGEYASIADAVPALNAKVQATGYPLHSAIRAQLTTEGKVLAKVEDRLIVSVPILHVQRHHGHPGRPVPGQRMVR